MTTESLFARPVGSDDGTLALNGGSIVDLNEGDQSAEFVVSSNDVDREGDVLEPSGCLPWLEEYKQNPVVLFEHDPKLGPIGTCERDGKFHFRVEKNRIVARVFFHCKEFMGRNLSRECWELTKCGALRGASPGFLPIESERRGYGGGRRFTNWRITEFSLTCQPVNALALKRAIDEGVVSKSMLPYFSNLLTSKALADDSLGESATFDEIAAEEPALREADVADVLAHVRGAISELPRMIDADPSGPLKALLEASEAVDAHYSKVFAAHYSDSLIEQAIADRDQADAVATAEEAEIERQKSMDRRSNLAARLVLARLAKAIRGEFRGDPSQWEPIHNWCAHIDQKSQSQLTKTERKVAAFLGRLSQAFRA